MSQSKKFLCKQIVDRKKSEIIENIIKNKLCIQKYRQYINHVAKSIKYDNKLIHSLQNKINIYMSKINTQHDELILMRPSEIHIKDVNEKDWHKTLLHYENIYLPSTDKYIQNVYSDNLNSRCEKMFHILDIMSNTKMIKNIRDK
jgi:hypothetical protein